MKFYKEKESGKIVYNIDIEERDKYQELIPNTTDASFEKHVPVYKIKDNEIEVKVGEVLHPMTEEHYIVWIIQVKDNEINKIELKPGDVPEVKFPYIKESEIYAYCNLHGIWKTTIK